MFPFGPLGWLPSGIALGALIACWIRTETTTRTNLILSVLYLASCGLLFVRGYEFLFWAAQCLLAIVNGWAAFGVDWLIRRH